MDEFDLEAIGNHGFIPSTWPGPNSEGGVMSAADALRYQTELEFAAILGMPFMGTGNDPTSANNRNIEPWTIAGEKWEALNVLSLEWGIYLYPHNHSPAYNFLQDGPMVEVTEDRLTGAPIAPTLVRGESGKRLMQHYIDVTDKDLCLLEMDIYWAHVAQHQHRWRYDWEGNRVEDIFDPLAQVAMQTKRYPLFHAKDGDADRRGSGRRQRLRDRPVRHRRHRLPELLQEHGRQGLPQPELRAGQRPRAAAATQAGRSATR